MLILSRFGPPTLTLALVLVPVPPRCGCRPISHLSLLSSPPSLVLVPVSGGNSSGSLAGVAVPAVVAPTAVGVLRHFLLPQQPSLPSPGVFFCPRTTPPRSPVFPSMGGDSSDFSAVLAVPKIDALWLLSHGDLAASASVSPVTGRVFLPAFSSPAPPPLFPHSPRNSWCRGGGGGVHPATWPDFPSPWSMTGGRRPAACPPLIPLFLCPAFFRQRPCFSALDKPS